MRRLSVHLSASLHMYAAEHLQETLAAMGEICPLTIQHKGRESMGISCGSAFPSYAQDAAEAIVAIFKAERGNRMSNKQTGVILLIAGLVLLAVSLLADVIGVGGQPGIIGWKQILGAVVGGLVALAGLLRLLLRRPPTD